MVRTQIQLPDELYARAKKFSERREISLAELARRGIEYILGVYASGPGEGRVWQPPTPRSLGWRGLSEEEIRDEAQRTVIETKLGVTRRKRRALN